MASSKGNRKPTKESPRIKKKSGDEDAKEHPLESKGKKGPKEVDGKKDGQIAQKKKSPRKDGKQKEHESLNKEIALELPNVELEEARKGVPLHQLCASCDEVNRRWPPPPYVDPNPRDPTLLYPGDEDPEFQPFRGDILIIHPGLQMGLIDLHRQLPKDGFVSSYDGSPSFEFALGDLILRMGTYDEQPMVVEKTKKETSKLGKEEKGASKKGEEKRKKKDQVKGTKDEKTKGGSSKKGLGKTNEQEEDRKVTEKHDFTYNPYEKLELYTCSGFITVEEQAWLEAERLATKAEKERQEIEAQKKGPKGIKEKKTKESLKGEVDGNEKVTKGKKHGKAEASGKKGVPEGEEGIEAKSTTSKGRKSPNKDMTQEDIHVEPGFVMEPSPKPKWRYLGSQMRLDNKSQKLLGKQCPGLTYFYRRYKRAGSRCDIHSLIPLLGEILINIGWLNNWYKNLEKWQKEENKYKSCGKWSTPGLPSREELIPGMILLRPLVGREHGKWPGWGLDGKKLPPPFLPQPLLPKEEDNSLEEPNKVEDGEIVPPPKCDCHRKSPCPKPPCPCHLYDPCPKLPNCGCVYCNPLPRKPKPSPHEEKPLGEEKKDGKSGKGKGKHKENDGVNTKDEKSAKGLKKDEKGENDMKQKDQKAKSKDPKDPSKDLKGKGKDGKDSKAKEDVSKNDLQEEVEIPKKPYVWGAVEMYLFNGEEEGWEYWGRSERICDTPYPLPGEDAKPKFLHIDDSLKAEEILEEKVGATNEESMEKTVKDSVLKKPIIDKNVKKVEKNLANKKLVHEESAKKNNK